MGSRVRADNADGFIDFEAVPEHGANPQETWGFIGLTHRPLKGLGFIGLRGLGFRVLGLRVYRA